MLHIIYKITNLKNEKIYIGKHSCEDINDEYMGSGKLIKRAIKKYGIENFKKEILYTFYDEIEAYKMEKNIVNEDFIKRKDVYNVIIGGDPFESINSNVELRKEKNRRAVISMNKIIWNDEGENNKENVYKSKLKWVGKNPHIISWRNLLKNSLKRLNTNKGSSTINLLGYSAEDLKYHISSLFTPGMSWENYGEWHIDHIKPVCSFDSNTPVSIVCALSNLQPLWATTREIDGIIYEGNLNKNKFYQN